MSDPLPIRPFTRAPQAHAQVPGSKSITNRALALAAMCRGEVILDGALFSRDTRIMAAALRQLGLSVTESEENSEIRLIGAGSQFPNSSADLFVGNAGTAARFLTAILCLREGGEYVLDGDPAMHDRPMRGLTDAMEMLGAKFNFHKIPGHFPFTIATSGFHGDRVTVDASASSQLLSALLFAVAGASKPITVEMLGETVSQPFVEMTLEMLGQFGVHPQVIDMRRFVFDGKETLRLPGERYHVEPDASAASYFLALPIATGGSVHVQGLHRTMLQGDIHFTNVLEACGLQVTSDETGIHTSASETCRGVCYDFTAISDTFLTLAALAPLLEEPTKIDGIAHTRKQETDRVAAMATELRKLGQNVDEEEGSLTIQPDLKELTKRATDAVSAGKLLEIDTYEDHRVAMSFGILGCADILGDGTPWLAIRDPECCGKTFPRFFEELENIRQSTKGARL